VLAARALALGYSLLRRKNMRQGWVLESVSTREHYRFPHLTSVAHFLDWCDEEASATNLGEAHVDSDAAVGLALPQDQYERSTAQAIRTFFPDAPELEVWS
jgi:hypothetical protein